MELLLRTPAAEPPTDEVTKRLENKTKSSVDNNCQYCIFAPMILEKEIVILCIRAKWDIFF
jgi:hypothetical protein